MQCIADSQSTVARTTCRCRDDDSGRADRSLLVLNYSIPSFYIDGTIGLVTLPLIVTEYLSGIYLAAQGVSQLESSCS